MGTYAPYGYIKDPADHNHLLIDDKVAHVVRENMDKRESEIVDGEPGEDAPAAGRDEPAPER